MVPLGDVARLQAGYGFPKALQGRAQGLYPFAKVGDISRAGRAGSKFLITADHFVDAQDLPLLRARTIPAGSTLFAKIGEAIKQNHRVIASRELLVDNNAMAAIPTAQIDSSYLYRYLQTIDLYAMTSSTTVPALRKSNLEQLRVPLPHLEEQRRIAAILDKTDDLRAKRREALAHLDALTQSIFHDMFGDPIRNPMGWPIHRIGDVLESANYGTSSKASSTGGLPVLRMNNISYSGQLVLDNFKYMDLTEKDKDKYLVRRGDVLFNRTNSAELVGKTALVTSDQPMAFAGYLVRLRTTASTTPEYLSAFMNLPQTKQTLRNMCKSIVGMANINAKEVQTIKMPVPPRAMQDQFATRIAAVERLKDHHRTQLTELDALFASLQHRAFSGTL